MERPTTRRKTLQDHIERAYELERPRPLRIGPRQEEFQILPKSVRFNMFLFEGGARKAFQIDGRQALYVKQDFSSLKRSLLHFLAKHCRVTDLVCVDYPYGLLVTSEHAIREVVPTFDEHTLPRDVMAQAGTLLGIPCTIVGDASRWVGNPHQIAITIDWSDDLKQYMCTDEEYYPTFGAAMSEYLELKERAEEYNAVFTADPILGVGLELRGKTRAGIDEFESEFVFDRSAPTESIRMYSASDVRRLVPVE